MAFNAEFKNRSIEDGIIKEELYSVEDGSLQGQWKGAVVGVGKIIIISSLTAEPENKVSKRFTVRTADDIVGCGRSVLRRLYREYKGEAPQLWRNNPAGAAQDSDEGATTEVGTDSAEFGVI